MNSLVIVALSMLVALAASSPCSQVCMGTCDMAKTNCDGAMVLGPLCAVAYGNCAAGCAAVCACDDGCEGTCQPELETCKQNAEGNLILIVQCSANYDVCTGQCQTGCAINTAVNTVGAVMGGGAAPAK